MTHMRKIVDVREEAGTEVLAGAPSGRRLFEGFWSRTPKLSGKPELLLLDFKDITVATASFLRESVFAFRDRLREEDIPLYPVVLNANDVVEDEFATLVAARGDTIVLYQSDDAGDLKEPRMLGRLDPKQKRAFDLVQEHGLTDAVELAALYGEQEGVPQPTAWNNRLAILHKKGAVMRISDGRSRRYRSMLGGQYVGD